MEPSSTTPDDDFHLIEDCVAGGRVAGASVDCVAVSKAGERFGGIRKCSFSSLRCFVSNVFPRSSVNPHVPATKKQTSSLGHHSMAPTLPSRVQRLTSRPTLTSQRLITPLSSPLATHAPSGLMLRHLTRALV